MELNSHWRNNLANHLEYQFLNNGKKILWIILCWSGTLALLECLYFLYCYIEYMKFCMQVQQICSSLSIHTIYSVNGSVYKLLDHDSYLCYLWFTLSEHFSSKGCRIMGSTKYRNSNIIYFVHTLYISSVTFLLSHWWQIPKIKVKIGAKELFN